MDASEYRIWQRVLEEPRQEAMGEALYGMARQSHRALGDYRALSRREGAAGGTKVRLPERLERENLDCIRGMFLLSVGRPLSVGREGEGKRNSPEGSFLYRRALEQLQEYTALSAQPNYGVVFGEMARRQAQICEALARILGKSTE